ncbi:hypothetical protein [Sinorhizobium alkalisoli]|uniref:Uncharacterized protein n=1 Tax=Sinorhizobium alkalisoli TaxID=1752398 RepID=A0A1E3V646_9HYPH|nr:hypothetical protein [Sinorhizobium alkalisoli]MCA1489636.1 hypothetical protein [Ensifer sp. NBAIM29]MCG5478342.1 hypothetical protein [Sinorhizobium alkalisoli]ODR89030.1 hypothetical protein A8M32_21425 [Sinorhizobium alkalisoli]QFI65429.1 hypothetical protein EKH55_0555 [Sinorhizobium alkalisoli]
MAASENSIELTRPVAARQTGEAAIPMALLELELSLDHFSGDEDDFDDFVRTVAKDVGGEFLFALPASGLIDDCLSIAVLRLGAGADEPPTILFVCLDADGSTVRAEESGERTAGLRNFAEAFVGVLERM